MKTYEPELGQVGFGQLWHSYDCPDYIEALLRELDRELERVFWNVTQRDDIYVSPFGNNGSSYDFGKFQVESYNWDDEAQQDYNFKYGDLKISWYKYLGRGMSINKEISPDEMIQIFSDCLQTVRLRDIDLIHEAELRTNKEIRDGIKIEELKPEDKYRRVTYISSGKDKVENGWITSWNQKFVFVRYHLGDTSAATSPQDLEFSDGLSNLAK